MRYCKLRAAEHWMQAARRAVRNEFKQVSAADCAMHNKEGRKKLKNKHSGSQQDWLLVPIMAIIPHVYEVLNSDFAQGGNMQL